MKFYQQNRDCRSAGTRAPLLLFLPLPNMEEIFHKFSPPFITFASYYLKIEGKKIFLQNENFTINSWVH